jgi:putative ABC transport system permease protein
MLKNYLRIAYRNFNKNSAFSFINIGGLSLGLVAFILILQYVSFEKSVNGFHANLPHLYRVLMQNKSGEVWDGVAPGMVSFAKQQLGQIKDYCRIAEGSSLGNGVVGLVDSTSNEKSFREKKFAYVDGSFFTLFSFEILNGNTNALQQPNTVAISQSTAKKYFNDTNAIGNLLTLNNQFGKTLYTVTMIYSDMPENSDFQYDLLFSIQTLADKANLNGNEGWASLEGMRSQWMKAYLLLQSESNSNLLELQITKVKNQVNPESTESIRLQPLAYQHLSNSLNDPFPTIGSLGFIYLISGISVLILVIAWFNYINLSTASSLKRAKEVGIRKVSGASKYQLIRQFLGESFVMNTLAFLISLAIINLIQGSYNYFINKQLSFEALFQTKVWIIGFILIFIGSLASGAYTAFVLSSFKPTQTLKGVFSKSSQGIWLRKTLVIFQFSISIALIGCTIILQRQLYFLQNTDLGMQLHQLLVINGAEVGKDKTFKDRSASFENELSQLGFIQDFCRTGGVPTDGYNYSTPGITRQNAMPGDEKLVYAILEADYRFLKTYSIAMAAGRGFTEEMGSRNQEERNTILVNEKAAKQLGFTSNENAVGQKIIMEEKEFELIGVVKDYHHNSLREQIDAIVFFPRNNGGFYSIKISKLNISAHVSELEKLFKKYFPGNPFDYYFIYDKYNEQYKTELQYGIMFSIASGVAIFIACLGLFGLAIFTVEQHVKQIGIRKVLGASITQITALITKDFLVLVIVSIFIATPISWYGMNKWLQEFAYQTEITWWIFGVAGLIAIVIALITVCSQTINAALRNPVESLRNE